MHKFYSCEVYYFLDGFIRFFHNFVQVCRSGQAMQNWCIRPASQFTQCFFVFTCLHIRNNRYICIYEID